MDMALINFEDEVPVEFSSSTKGELVADLIKAENELTVASTKRKTAYMIFAFDRARERFGIDYETIIVLNYLNELKVFTLTVMIDNKRFLLGDYIELGLIGREYKVRHKDFYCLTQKSIDIVDSFNSMLEDTNELISENRVTDLDVETKVSDVLAKYFKS